VLYYEGTSVDISDRKRLETERRQTEETLQQLNSELESCIYQRTIELEKTIQQLQREVANRQHIEELLLQNEAQFQQLAATVPGMLFQYVQYPDGSDVFIYISPGCQTLYDVSPEQGLKSTRFMWEKIYPDDVQTFLDGLARAAQRQETCYIEYRITLSSNCLKWLAVNARPEKQIDGSILWHGITVDITKRKQIEEALQYSEERFRTLFNESPFGVALVNMEDQFIQVNPAHCQMVGRDEQELLQMRFTDFTHPDDLTSDSELMRQLIEQRIFKFQLKKRFFKKNGELFWANLTVVPICNSEGKMLYTLGTIQDITEQMQAEEATKRSEEQLRLVLQNMPVMLDVFDRAGNIIVWNQECERVTGYSAAEIIGNPNALEMLYPDSNYLRSMLLQWAERGLNFRNWEWDITCKDGSVKTIAWSNLAQEFPVVGWESWAIGIDVSERKKAEAEMLNALNQERELNELKSQFITTVSHEFRTPLSTILASTELLERYDYQWCEEKRHLRYQRIIEAIARMTHLLDDVLFVGKAEARRLEFNPSRVDVVNFCQELLEELNLNLKEKHTLKFTCEGSSNTILSVDVQLLRHILYNLISNAIKYSPQGGEISINLLCQAQKVTFQIQDTGIGIDPQDQEHLFTLFKRGKNVGTILGTGLGLTIVKRCVELHGGNIAIESELGVGTLVNITLPLNNS
jgi:PAS domain S-box-containing protein